MQEWWELWDLVKKSAPVIGTRLLSAVEGVLLTFVVSKKSPELLSKLTMPLALADSAYFSSTMLVTQAISKVNDSNITEYYVSGMILEGFVTPAISTVIFELLALALGLSNDVKIFIALLGLVLSARQMNMLTRQMMIVVKKNVGILDGAHISLITMLLKTGLFFGLSWGLDSSLELMGVFIALLGSSVFKLFLDSIYLAFSKKVFHMPNGSRVWEEMKARVKEGGLVSLQTLLELLVFLWGLPLLAHWNGPAASTALQIALTTENLTNPLSFFTRGMQRQMDEQVEQPQKMKASAHRAVLTTAVVSLIPLAVFLAVPRQITGIFTQNTAVLDASEKVMRLVAGGQALYNVRATQEAAVRTLPPEDTKYALGVSAVSAVIFFGLAIPLTLKSDIGFNGAAGIFTALMALSLLMYLPRYFASTTQSKCLKKIGIFKDTSPEQMPLVARQASINDGPK